MDNKNNFIKGALTFVLSIVFSISFVNAQNIDENITIRSSLNSMFEGVNAYNAVLQQSSETNIP